ncbi:hypothetical protein [Roseivirga sp. UBA838]|uniref:hypothetical protein n=1 Tax=Roseivirga sp. UBA838 TaxID=1947393 RepID=UPI00257AFEFE|nr:hypothetical protein [Roseivirga sp. UBA838]|tara:strand:+ start:28903 stop:29373 length:471 start_codon:yes stop_codon:yes gene_type:complete
MKAKFIVLASLLMLSFGAQAQSFYRQNRPQKDRFSVSLKNITTRSVNGWNTGPSVSLNLGQRFSMGYVYLTAIGSAEREANTFSGLQFNYSVFDGSRFDVGVGLRTGVHNQYFISVLPSIQMTYDVSTKVAAELGYAHSDGFPFFQMGIGYKIFRK